MGFHALMGFDFRWFYLQVMISKEVKQLLSSRPEERTSDQLQTVSFPLLFTLFQAVCVLGPVYTYPDIFESTTISFWIRLPSTRIWRIRQRIRIFLNPLSWVENKSATNPITCGRLNPDIFESDDAAAKSSPVFYRTTNQYGEIRCRSCFSLAHLKTFYCREALGTRVNPDTLWYRCR